MPRRPDRKLPLERNSGEFGIFKLRSIVRKENKKICGSVGFPRKNEHKKVKKINFGENSEEIEIKIAKQKSEEKKIRYKKQGEENVIKIEKKKKKNRRVKILSWFSMFFLFS